FTHPDRSFPGEVLVLGAETFWEGTRGRAISRVRRMTAFGQTSPFRAPAGRSGVGTSRSLPGAPAEVSSLCFADLHHQNLRPGEPGPVAVLDRGRVGDDAHRQPFSVDQGVDFAALHLLAGVVTHSLSVSPPFPFPPI